jgi:hypothetical protein
VTINLDKFHERVQGHRARGAQNFVMTMADAEQLNNDIQHLLHLFKTLEKQVQDQEQQSMIEVKIHGGAF